MPADWYPKSANTEMCRQILLKLLCARFNENPLTVLQFDLKLSRWLNAIKSSRATTASKWNYIPYSSDLSSGMIVLMMEAARTSETSIDNYFTRQYIPEDKSELHTRRRENLKSHIFHTVPFRRGWSPRRFYRIFSEAYCFILNFYLHTRFKSETWGLREKHFHNVVE
jgi:hypothetical protein